MVITTALKMCLLWIETLTSSTGAVSTATAVLPVAQGRVVRAPIGGMNSVVSPAGTLLSSQRPVLLQNDKAVTGTSAGMQTSLTSRGSGVIDLTDEDEGDKNDFLKQNSLLKFSISKKKLRKK